MISSDQEKKLLTEIHDLQQQVLRLAEFEKNYLVVQEKLQAAESKLHHAETEHLRIQTELQMAKLIVERSPVILFRRRADAGHKLEYISSNIEQLGYTPSEFFDNEIIYKDIVHPDDHKRVTEEIDKYADIDVEEYTMFYRCITRSGKIRWIEDQTSVVRDERGNKTHNQGVLFDITERREAEEALRNSEEKFRRIVETAAEGFILLDQESTIIDVNNAFCTMLGYTAQELLGRNFAVCSVEEMNGQTLHSCTKFSVGNCEFETTLIGKAHNHIPVLIHGNSLSDDKGQIIGNMAFITDMTAHKRALMLAEEVQRSLLPQEKPQVTNYDIAGRNVSCDEIGGDYYDFIWRQDSESSPFGVVVGDVSGHGIDSALLMTTARAFLRMRASQPGTISEIITAMNQHLALDVLDTGRFMTLFYLGLDPATDTITWVRAGHDPALLYDPHTDDFEELKGTGIALGVMDDVRYLENSRVGIKTGHILVVGTDGIWEAFNTKDEMFGKERLQNIIRKHAHQSAQTILDAVYEDVQLFTAGKKSEDDITLVVIKRNPSE